MLLTVNALIRTKFLIIFAFVVAYTYIFIIYRFFETMPIFLKYVT